MALIGSSNSERIWNYLSNKGLNSFAIAGCMGNLDAESGLNPKNLEDSYQAKIGLCDEEYTRLVDLGTYTRSQFSTDQAGYGLCQWTWHTRKANLYDYAKAKQKSIGDLETQLEFFCKELSESYQDVLQGLKSASSVREASDLILLKYERPASCGANVQIKRANMGQVYYSQFASGKEVGSSMGYKYFTKGQAVKVSAHFYSTEFDCHGSGCCNQTVVNEKLIELVEKIRVHFNAPVTITSPYRCPTHNSRPSVGGAPGSRHTKGDAADIVVKGVAPRKVAQYAESIGIFGIGLYETESDGYFVHIDTRDYRSFWYGQSERSVTTFGAYSSGVASNSANTSLVDTILNIGDKGSVVKALQEKLIKLGFSCGDAGADGDFGGDTFNAVKKFQESMNLGADGIAGNQTLTALDKAIASQGSSVKKYVRITANILNVRSGVGMSSPIVSNVRKGAICAVIEEKDGWGKIVSPAGWISGQYYEDV